MKEWIKKTIEKMKENNLTIILVESPPIKPDNNIYPLVIDSISTKLQ